MPSIAMNLREIEDNEPSLREQYSAPTLDSTHHLLSLVARFITLHLRKLLRFISFAPETPVLLVAPSHLQLYSQFQFPGSTGGRFL